MCRPPRREPRRLCSRASRWCPTRWSQRRSGSPWPAQVWSTCSAVTRKRVPGSRRPWTGSRTPTAPEAVLLMTVLAFDGLFRADFESMRHAAERALEVARPLDDRPLTAMAAAVVTLANAGRWGQRSGRDRLRRGGGRLWRRCPTRTRRSHRCRRPPSGRGALHGPLRRRGSARRSSAEDRSRHRSAVPYADPDSGLRSFHARQARRGHRGDRRWHRIGAAHRHHPGSGMEAAHTLIGSAGGRRPRHRVAHRAGGRRPDPRVGRELHRRVSWRRSGRRLARGRGARPCARRPWWARPGARSCRSFRWAWRAHALDLLVRCHLALGSGRAPPSSRGGRRRRHAGEPGDREGVGAAGRGGRGP